MTLVSRASLKRLAILFLLLGVAVLVSWFVMIRMPGKSHSGALPPLTPEQGILRDELKADVKKLASDIGSRNTYNHKKLSEAADYIENSFTKAGYKPQRQSYTVDGKKCDNIEVELPGTSKEIVLVGAHYDTDIGSPGANDNSSGIAATLALARRFAGKPTARTLRFVAFVNEEPPYFETPQMGSFVYAKRSRERGEKITAMISLETIGCFFHEEGTQKFPLPLFKAIYPTRGDYIAFIGNPSSASLVKKAIGSFRAHAQFPSEGSAPFAWIPGVGWSDQWGFWKHGYRAIMISDTAVYRYPHYHKYTDTPEKCDFDSMARVVDGVEKVVADLAR